jgi:hypothetical protein
MLRKLLLSIRSSKVKIRASEFPSFLHPENTRFDQSKPLVGLFRGPLLVRVGFIVFQRLHFNYFLDVPLPFHLTIERP